MRTPRYSTAEDAATCVLELMVVRLPEPKQGFVLLPRRWVVERSFAWATRFRRLAKDDERLPKTVAGLHVVACTCSCCKNWRSYLSQVHDTR